MFTVYNEIASLHNTLKAKAWRAAHLDHQHLEGFALQKALSPIWQQLETNKPYGYDCFNCSDEVALWLYSILTADFYFSAGGMRNPQKDRLSFAIKRLASSTQAENPRRAKVLSNFSAFLDRHAIVFPN